MRYTYVLVLLAVVGWLGGSTTDALAQEAPPPLRTMPLGEPALNPGEPPTPQALRVAVDFGPDGLAFRVLYDPAWRALFRPQVRVGRVRTEPPLEEDTAPRIDGGTDQLHQALAQALDRAQHPAAPSP
jgi:hypothetical protein